MVSSLRKALQKHKASFVLAEGERDWPLIVFLGDQLLVCGLFLELSGILQGWLVTEVQHGCLCLGGEAVEGVVTQAALVSLTVMATAH